jgi:hypothetical protein
MDIQSSIQSRGIDEKNLEQMPVSLLCVVKENAK